MSSRLVFPRLARILFPACAVLLVAGTSGCGQQSTAQTKGGGKSGKGGGAAPVLVSQVQRKRVPLAINAIGVVEPLRTTAIRSQVSGTLQRIAIREGQEVREGDLLLEVDARPFRNALQSAEADLQKVRVQLEKAKTQLARYRTLSAEQMISKEQFERIQDELHASEAERVASEARVANAKLQLEYCSIRAPLSGRTGNINVHQGDLVRANDTAALLTINQINPINVTFGVPQQHLSAVTQYHAKSPLPVRAVPPGIDEKPEQGELSFMDNAVDPSTGTIRLKATFSNGTQRLWPGQFVDVTITLAEPEVLAVSSSAVQASQRGQHVFVVTPDNIAELRPVVVERTHESESIILKGLAEGERVVVDGQLRVIPGRAVEIKQPLGAAAPGEPGAQTSAKAGAAKGTKKVKKET